MFITNAKHIWASWSTTTSDPPRPPQKKTFGLGPRGISGDVKPFPEWSPKDDLGFSVAAGEGIGGYLPNTRAVATNFGGNLRTSLGAQAPTIVGGMAGGTSFSTFNASRAAYDAVVRGATITAFNAKLGYVHWWTPELRTNMDFSFVHQDVPNLIFTSAVTTTG